MDLEAVGKCIVADRVEKVCLGAFASVDETRVNMVVDELRLHACFSQRVYVGVRVDSAVVDTVDMIDVDIGQEYRGWDEVGRTEGRGIKVMRGFCDAVANHVSNDCSSGDRACDSGTADNGAVEFFIFEDGVFLKGAVDCTGGGLADLFADRDDSFGSLDYDFVNDLFGGFFLFGSVLLMDGLSELDGLFADDESSFTETVSTVGNTDDGRFACFFAEGTEILFEFIEVYHIAALPFDNNI